MTPADLILGFLGRGPATRMALVGLLLGRRYDYANAELEVGQAILALVKAGRIESFGPDCWRLTASAAPMEKRTSPTDRLPCVKTSGNQESQDEVAHGLNQDGSGE